MNKIQVTELEFEADAAGALEETRVSPSVIKAAIKAIAKVITETVN